LRPEFPAARALRASASPRRHGRLSLDDRARPEIFRARFSRRAGPREEIFRVRGIPSPNFFRQENIIREIAARGSAAFQSENPPACADFAPASRGKIRGKFCPHKKSQISDVF
jgi:hypothetical protein